MTPRNGRHAVAVERYGWPALAQRFADVLDGAVVDTFS
jgi:hypothetical protein